MGTGNALDSKGNLFSGVAFVATSQGPADDGNCASYCNQHKASFTIISNISNFTNHFIILFSLTPSLFFCGHSGSSNLCRYANLQGTFFLFGGLFLSVLWWLALSHPQLQSSAKPKCC
jgi:hypothetical protein